MVVAAPSQSRSRRSPMPEWGSIYPDDQEWSPINPQAADTRVVTRVPVGSVSNDHLAGGISPLKLQGVGMRVSLSATQTVTNGADEPIEFDTTELNQGGFVPLSSNLVTVPYAGFYILFAGVSWDGAGSAVDDERSWFLVNGTKVQGNTSPNISANRQRYMLSTTQVLAAGDTVGVTVRHGSASGRSLGTSDPLANNLTVVFLFPV